MYDPRASRIENIKRVLATDNLVFSYANHVLILTAWCTATNIGFVCMDKQIDVHVSTNIGLWLMAGYAVVMGIRLLISAILASNALFGGAVGSGSFARVVGSLLLASSASYMAFGLIFVVANSVAQAQSICWIMPASMFEPSIVEG